MCGNMHVLCMCGSVTTCDHPSDPLNNLYIMFGVCDVGCVTVRCVWCVCIECMDVHACIVCVSGVMTATP